MTLEEGGGKVDHNIGVEALDDNLVLDSLILADMVQYILDQMILDETWAIHKTLVAGF